MLVALRSNRRAGWLVVGLVVPLTVVLTGCSAADEASPAAPDQQSLVADRDQALLAPLGGEVSPELRAQGVRAARRYYSTYVEALRDPSRATTEQIRQVAAGQEATELRHQLDFYRERKFRLRGTYRPLSTVVRSGGSDVVQVTVCQRADGLQTESSSGKRMPTDEPYAVSQLTVRLADLRVLRLVAEGRSSCSV